MEEEVIVLAILELDMDVEHLYGGAYGAVYPVTHAVPYDGGTIAEIAVTPAIPASPTVLIKSPAISGCKVGGGTRIAEMAVTTAIIMGIMGIIIHLTFT
ncbi:hypothetical protein K435DRAFT_781477 [Dendrothele bispora CBS 962.96]|uniref:Uncharacterized protein n=1 Tax=Dendrothele bispora (strain CBS 962.96) TaxID=1314807 RepID=A0A4S8LKI4_DENBC|nr:hypothetical protein K435DRAFT_781477 [Dendrothele bispora CBS 962.96]